MCDDYLTEDTVTAVGDLLKPGTEPRLRAVGGARLVNLAARAAHRVDDREAIVGRSPAVEVVLPDKAVSRQHARLFRREDQWFVEDLGSHNGTWVNGEKVTAETAIDFGDTIRFGATGATFVFTAHDEVQERIFYMQKMDAVGRLAGGVAHDMNNILAMIALTAEALKADLASDGEAQGALDDVLAATRRGGELAKNLLGFARKGRYRRERLSLNKTIEGIHRLMRRTVHSGIELELELAEDLAEIEGDSSQLGQVVLNLAVNGAQAMAGHGRLTIRTSNVILANKQVAELAAGRYVRLEVNDDGVGMDKATAAKIFEPFFTTKAPGEGTGLGLAMVHGAVESHGGHVSLDSAPGIGSTFTVLLPALDASLTPHAVADRTMRLDAATVSRCGTVMVVDDEPLLRKSTCNLLTRLGFQTIGAANGSEALEIFAKEGWQVVAVLLDMMMPVMDGPETFRRLKALDPDVNVVLVSGYSADGEVNDLFEAGLAAVLEKPYELKDLEQVLDLVLSGRSAR